MTDRLRRVCRARVVVGMAALAFPLLAVGTAQAAIAGANPESTTNRPDLVSATALNGNMVDYCFDKQLNNIGFNNTLFTLGGYRAQRSVTAGTVLLEQTADTTGKCVRAIFPSGDGGGAEIGDVGQYTIATVGSGAVQTIAGVTSPTAGLSDSTTLTVPSSLNPTHNGTAGFTVGPDLVGVLLDPTTNTIIYTEDQDISTATAPAAGAFQFTRSGGTVCHGLAIAPGFPSGNQVAVIFGPVASCPVTDAARAGQLPGALFAAADPGLPSTADQAIVPASNTTPGTGTTALPDLISTTIEPNTSAIDYVFDKTVATGAPGAFFAVLSDGITVGSTSASVIATSTSSTTVRATFPVVTQFAMEYVVKAGVLPGAVVESSPPNNANQFDTRPAGDNAGAFARGFTTAPDVFNASINKTTGVVTATVDQRVFAAAGGGVNLLDSTGNVVATSAAGSISFPSQAPGPQQLTIQFSPGQTQTAVNVSVQPALLTATGEFNVPQILQASTTSAATRAAIKRVVAKVNTKQVKRQAAARRAQASRWNSAHLSKWLRHHKHSRQHR